MTKKELLEELADYPDDTQVYLAKDTEGNAIRPLYDTCEVLTTDPKAYDLTETNFYFHDDVGGSVDSLTTVVVLWP